MNNENRTPHWIPRPSCNEKTVVKICEDDISVNRHLPKVGTDPLRVELSHFLFKRKKSNVLV